MATWTHYLTPTTVEGALAALAQARGPARLIAGGTDLLLDLQQGRQPPVDTLVDVTRIPELGEIQLEEHCLYLGAAVTLATLLQHEELAHHARCLVEACRLIGGPQVRNVATIGGNVAHALPAADGTIALLALDAQAQIASPEGRRWTPLETLFAGPGQAAFNQERELLVGFRFALRHSGETSAFRRVMRPQGVAIAIMNMAVWIRWGMRAEIQDVRLAVGAAGPRPLRARRTEEALRGAGLSQPAIAKAIEVLASEARLRTSPHRATADYRRQLLEVLLRRTLAAVRPNSSSEAPSAALEGQGS